MTSIMNAGMLFLALFFSCSFAYLNAFYDSDTTIECKHGCITGHDVEITKELYTHEDWIYLNYIEGITTEGEEVCKKTYNKNYTGSKVTVVCAFELPEKEGHLEFELFAYYTYPASPQDIVEDEIGGIGMEVREPECAEDDDCEEDEECSHEECIQLSCLWNEYLDDHECVEVECTSDSDCGPNSDCVYNECIGVECREHDDCGPLKACEDLKCVEVECKLDGDCKDYQICMSGHYCRDLDCPGFEIPKNHTCVNPECIMDEGCVGTKICINQTCVPLECEGGYAANHACIPYECNESPDCAVNESCIGFFCEPLECLEGYFSHNHQCIQCLEDSDCPETDRCSKNSCIPVSCMGGEVVLHECVMPKASPEEGVPEEPVLEGQDSHQFVSSPEPAKETKNGCLPAFALLLPFALFLKNKVLPLN